MRCTAQQGVPRDDGLNKKLIESHLFNPDETKGEDSLLKAAALIQANLHKNPWTGSDEDFATDYASALWLENWRTERQVQGIKKAIAEMFSSDSHK